MIEFSLEFPELDEILPLVKLASTDPFVGGFGTKKPSDSKEFRTACRTCFAMRKQLGLKTTLMREDGELIGYGLSTRCNGRRAYLAKLPMPNNYWKIGLLFVHPDHRGRGIATQAGKWFLKQKKHMVWFVDVKNIASEKVAIAIGLKFSHIFYETLDGVSAWLPEDFPKDKPKGVTMQVYKN